MKPTGIISILLIVVLTILFNMSANVVEASYEDADTIEEELRFPFNNELETVKNKANNNAKVSTEKSSVDNTATNNTTKKVTEKKVTKKNKTAKKGAVESTVTNAVTDATDAITKVDSKAGTAPKKVATKESKKTTKKATSTVDNTSVNTSTTKSAIPTSSAKITDTANTVADKSELITSDAEMIEEVEIVVEDTNMIGATSVKAADEIVAEEKVSTGEIIIEDVSIIETAAFLDGVDGNESVDLPPATPVMAAMSESDRTFFNLYEAAKNSTANIEDKSSKFESFIRPFKQLIIAETGDAKATIENIKIYDVYGKKVLEVSDLDLGGSAFNILPRGNYTIEVISGSAFHTAILSKL